MKGFDVRRIESVTDKPEGDGPVIYWMSRDQRVEDNWALARAHQKAIERGSPLAVAFCLTDEVPGASRRHIRFMLEGLAGEAKRLLGMGIQFHFLTGSPGLEVAGLAGRIGAGLVVSDYGPLRQAAAWRRQAGERLSCCMETVDAHNIVPAHFVTDKREYAAYTIRPKLNALLGGFLEPAPSLPSLDMGAPGEESLRRLEDELSRLAAFGTGGYPEAGSEAASRRLASFLRTGLDRYHESNDPNLNLQSGLSPYIHFGQVSARKVVAEALLRGGRGADDFVEQAFIRRELAENFCRHCTGYDSAAGFPDWGRKTLLKHAADPRDHIYSFGELEAGKTHDRLWNAAQRQLTGEGAMPSYLRMYWAKKLLEWTGSPDEAMDFAVRLNDGYSLDGRDPNGYAGISWSIGGVHDRPWGERAIFGMVRYMSYAGMRRKFDVDRYIEGQASRQTGH